MTAIAAEGLENQATGGSPSATMSLLMMQN
jgi:hypothetical protein